MKKFKLYFSTIISLFLFMVAVGPITLVSASEKMCDNKFYTERYEDNRNAVKIDTKNVLQTRAVGYDPIYTTKRIQIDRSDVKGYIDFCVVEHYNTVMKSWVLGNYYITGSGLKGYGNMEGANFGAEIKSSSVAIGSRTGSIITLTYRVFNYRNNMTFIVNDADINL